ncbi:hypothetical protein ACIBI3_01535 [Actinomadura luteofluorescens]|uniref:hypothetical protein n=1 Tax=Actinomadura luteofluorescens TaxID=46163 RepID=UPI00347A56D6
MKRSWSIAAAICATGCLSFTQWDTSAHIPVRLTAFRYGDDPVLRVFSFFAPLTPNDSVSPHLAPWIWPLRLGVYLLTIGLVYLAALSVTARTGHVGALLRWTSVVMLAFGAGEVTALAIVILGDLDDAERVSLAVEIDVRSGHQFWTSDALFAGVGMSLWVGLPLAGLHLVHRVRQAKRPGDGSGVLATTVGDLPGRARHVATVGIIPAVCLALLGGSTRFVSSDAGHKLSLPEALSDLSLYPRLRPKPPPDALDDWLAPGGGRKLMEYSDITESWPVSTAVALVFLVLLWLLMWKAVSALETGARHGTLHAFLFGWALVVLTGALTGLFHAALTRLTYDGIGLGGQVTLILPLAMRFGVVWGWLVGLAVALSYRRSRPPAAAAAPTGTPAETTP